jgi:hypothetical protein
LTLPDEIAMSINNQQRDYEREVLEPDTADVRRFIEAVTTRAALLTDLIKASFS